MLVRINSQKCQDHFEMRRKKNVSKNRNRKTESEKENYRKSYTTKGNCKRNIIIKTTHLLAHAAEVGHVQLEGHAPLTPRPSPVSSPR